MKTMRNHETPREELVPENIPGGAQDQPEASDGTEVTTQIIEQPNIQSTLDEEITQDIPSASIIDSSHGTRKKRGAVKAVGIATVTLLLAGGAYFVGRGDSASTVTEKTKEAQPLLPPADESPVSETTATPNVHNETQPADYDMVQSLRAERDAGLNAEYLAVAGAVNDFMFGENGEVLSENFGAQTSALDDAIFLWTTENPVYSGHATQILRAPQLAASALHTEKLEESIYVQFSVVTDGKRDAHTISFEIGFDQNGKERVEQKTRYYVAEREQTDVEKTQEPEKFRAALAIVSDLLDRAKSETSPRERQEASERVLKVNPDFDPQDLNVFSQYR